MGEQCRICRGGTIEDLADDSVEALFAVLRCEHRGLNQKALLHRPPQDGLYERALAALGLDESVGREGGVVGASDPGFGQEEARGGRGEEGVGAELPGQPCVDGEGA